MSILLFGKTDLPLPPCCSTTLSPYVEQPGVNPKNFFRWVTQGGRWSTPPPRRVRLRAYPRRYALKQAGGVAFLEACGVGCLQHIPPPSSSNINLRSMTSGGVAQHFVVFFFLSKLIFKLTNSVTCDTISPKTDPQTQYAQPSTIGC